MNATTWIIAAVLVAAAVIPIMVMGRKRTSRKKFLNSKMDAMALRNGNQITIREIFGEMAIGLDENKPALFFFDHDEKNPVEVTVPLDGISTCTFASEVRNPGNGASVVTDRLWLRLIPADQKKKEISIELYNSDTDAQLSGELQFAEKWQGIISSVIRK